MILLTDELRAQLLANGRLSAIISKRPQQGRQEREAAGDGAGGHGQSERGDGDFVTG